MSMIDWNEAPEGFDYAITPAPGWDGDPARKGSIQFVRKIAGGGFMTMHGTYPVMGPQGWMAVAERPAPWTGEGHPPAGTVCEVLNNTLDQPEWERCTILFMGKFKAVYESESCHERVADVSESWMISFRPLRTPEQIAAEERLHNVRNACSAIADTLDSLRGKTKVERAALAVVEAMIDAGYTRVDP